MLNVKNVKKQTIWSGGSSLTNCNFPDFLHNFLSCSNKPVSYAYNLMSGFLVAFGGLAYFIQPPPMQELRLLPCVTLYWRFTMIVGGHFAGWHPLVNCLQVCFIIHRFGREICRKYWTPFLLGSRTWAANSICKPRRNIFHLSQLCSCLSASINYTLHQISL